MRPCQHCGTAILPKHAVCPECDGKQTATVGGEHQAAAETSFPTDSSVVDAQIQTFQEGENWLFRTLLCLCVIAFIGLQILAYSKAGFPGLVWVAGAMLLGPLMSPMLLGAHGVFIPTSKWECLVFFLLAVVLGAIAFSVKVIVDDYKADPEATESRLGMNPEIAAGESPLETRICEYSTHLKCWRREHQLYEWVSCKVSCAFEGSG